jgi:hypothetical protein
MQIRTATVGVKRTPSDERPPLTFELDPVPSDNLVDWVSLLESSRVDPPRTSREAGKW